MGCLEEWERRNETSFTATMMWSRAERQQKVIDSRWKWFERKSCMSSSLWRWIQRESEPLTKLKIVVIRYTIVGRLMSFQSSWSPETFAAVFNFPLFSRRDCDSLLRCDWKTLQFPVGMKFSPSHDEAKQCEYLSHIMLNCRGEKVSYSYLFFHRCALPSEKVFLGLFHQ